MSSGGVESQLNLTITGLNALSVPVRTEQYFCALRYQLAPKLVRHVDSEPENIPLAPVDDIFLNENDVLKKYGFYIMTVVNDPRLPRLAKAHVGVTQGSQGASVLCEV